MNQTSHAANTANPEEKPLFILTMVLQTVEKQKASSEELALNA